MAAISVDNLSMTYRVPVRKTGLRAAFRSLFQRDYSEVRAVQEISFHVEPGELVGFIGPNGAGKTTTLKILSGILHPTGGQARVLAAIPWRREPGFLRQIALIRGSKAIGGPDELTVMDSLRFQQLIYEVSDADFRRNVAEMAELLDLGHLLDRQVRALSLGERMRAGLALALLYRPKVLFLDEPTLGLDVTAVGVVRRFLADYSRRTAATVLLTSHYAADIETLCSRIILIDQGRLAYDGDLAGLSRAIIPYKLVTATLADDARPAWEQYGEVVEVRDGSASLRVHRSEVPAVTARLLAELAIADLSVADPPLETVIDRVYREGVG